MSRSVSQPAKFVVFLRQALFQPVGKNKVRKQLLSLLDESLAYLGEDTTNMYTISYSVFDGLITFLQKDGKGDRLRDDELLNFVTSVRDLSTSFSQFLQTAPIDTTLSQRVRNLSGGAASVNSGDDLGLSNLYQTSPTQQVRSTSTAVQPKVKDSSSSSSS